MLNISITLSERTEQELLARFEETKQEFPNVTMESFCKWAIRYYLQHAYKDEEESAEEEE